MAEEMFQRPERASLISTQKTGRQETVIKYVSTP